MHDVEPGREYCPVLQATSKAVGEEQKKPARHVKQAVPFAFGICPLVHAPGTCVLDIQICPVLFSGQGLQNCTKGYKFMNNSKTE